MDDGHWVAWHESYEDPASRLNKRLAAVKRRLGDALDQRPPGPIRIVSMCAGQGRDVIEVLTDHPRAGDVTAHLVELDATLAADARARAEGARVGGITVVNGDASSTDTYAELAPADIWLICGLFGNISKPDIANVLAEMPHLCTAGATVIWTRHRRAPDHTTVIRAQLAALGFTDLGFDAGDAGGGTPFGVGSSRFDGQPLPYRPGRRFFTFVGPSASL